MRRNWPSTWWPAWGISSGREGTVRLTSDAVWLVTEGFASDIELVAQPTVGEMIAQLIDNGGAIWACAACTGSRGIEPNHLVDGCRRRHP